LKQAWWKYLITKIGFLAEEIKLAMTMSILDTLPVIPHDQIVEFGIPSVHQLIEQ